MPKILTLPEGLLSLSSGVIGHQVNCRGVMRAGLAGALRAKYPVAYGRYHQVCQRWPPGELLGKVHAVKVGDLEILNLFGQDRYGRGQCHTDYAALRRIAATLRERYLRVHLPWEIGCGLGGGDWAVVREIFAGEHIVWVQRPARARK